jgi:hypothetical protein
MNAPRLLIFTLSFAATGLISAALFHNNITGNMLINGLPAGPIFTVVVIIVSAIITGRFNLFGSLVYLALMYLCYLAVFICTLYSTFAAAFAGIILCGLGAAAAFMLTRQYLAPVQYDWLYETSFGAAAFLLNDILLFEPVQHFIRPVYVVQGSPLTVFAPSIFFWQTIVGWRLSRALLRTGGQQQTF